MAQPLSVDASRLADDSFYVSLEFFYQWRSQLQRSNVGKVGAPFEFPAALVEYIAWVRVRTGLDYRGLEAFSRGMLAEVAVRLAGLGMPKEDIRRFRVPHFTQIRRRVAQIRLDPTTAAQLANRTPIYLVLDVDGPKVSNALQWSRNIVGARVTRGWVRVPATQPPVATSP